MCPDVESARMVYEETSWNEDIMELDPLEVHVGQVMQMFMQGEG